MHERPVLGNMDMRRVLPLGVVDEQQAAGLELGQRRPRADRTIPAIDDQLIERGIRQGLNGRGIGRKHRVVKGIGFRVRMLQRHKPEIHLLESGNQSTDLLEPSSIVLEVGDALETFRNLQVAPARRWHPARGRD